MNNNAHSQPEDNEADSLLSQAATLLDESRALSYAVVMALAQTPREELSREEIDALCQLAYELQNKITKTLRLFGSSASTPRSRESVENILPRLRGWARRSAKPKCKSSPSKRSGRTRSPAMRRRSAPI